MKESKEIIPLPNFNDTYDTCSGLIQNTVRRFYPLPPGTDSNGIEQAATLGLWRASKQFDPDREASFKTYATSCMENGIIDYFRKIKAGWGNASTTIISESDPEFCGFNSLHGNDFATPDETLLAKEWLEDFGKALDELPATQRKAYELVCFQGLSLTDANPQINTGAFAAKNALKQAREQLREAVPSPFVEY